jgi:hypothetical protein
MAAAPDVVQIGEVHGHGAGFPSEDRARYFDMVRAGHLLRLLQRDVCRIHALYAMPARRMDF